MSKRDITQYSDSELSLLFFNEEGLYRAMQASCEFSEVK